MSAAVVEEPWLVVVVEEKNRVVAETGEEEREAAEMVAEVEAENFVANPVADLHFAENVRSERELGRRRSMSISANPFIYSPNSKSSLNL